MARRPNRLPEEGLEPEKQWRVDYGAYAWLCQIKHPTLWTVAHEAGASGTDGLLIAGVPDARDADLIVKGLIAFHTLSPVLYATRVFAWAAQPDTASDVWQAFTDVINRATHSILAAAKTVEGRSVPFGIGDLEPGREWKRRRDRGT